jgi:hypothetical protein
LIPVSCCPITSASFDNSFGLGIADDSEGTVADTGSQAFAIGCAAVGRGVDPAPAAKHTEDAAVRPFRIFLQDGYSFRTARLAESVFYPEVGGRRFFSFPEKRSTLAVLFG